MIWKGIDFKEVIDIDDKKCAFILKSRKPESECKNFLDYIKPIYLRQKEYFIGRCAYQEFLKKNKDFSESDIKRDENNLLDFAHMDKLELSLSNNRNKIDQLLLEIEQQRAQIEKAEKFKKQKRSEIDLRGMYELLEELQTQMDDLLSGTELDENFKKQYFCKRIGIKPETFKIAQMAYQKPITEKDIYIAGLLKKLGLDLKQQKNEITGNEHGTLEERQNIFKRALNCSDEAYPHLLNWYSKSEFPEDQEFKNLAKKLLLI